MAYWIIALVLLLLIGIIVSNLMALKKLDRYAPKKRDNPKGPGPGHPDQAHRWEDDDE